MSVAGVTVADAVEPGALIPESVLVVETSVVTGPIEAAGSVENVDPTSRWLPHDTSTTMTDRSIGLALMLHSTSRRRSQFRSFQNRHFATDQVAHIARSGAPMQHSNLAGAKERLRPYDVDQRRDGRGRVGLLPGHHMAVDVERERDARMP
jgi:hypothetical protein